MTHPLLTKEISIGKAIVHAVLVIGGLIFIGKLVEGSPAATELFKSPYTYGVLTYLLVQFLPLYIFLGEGKGRATMKVMTFILSLLSMIMLGVVGHPAFLLLAFAAWPFAFATTRKAEIGRPRSI